MRTEPSFSSESQDHVDADYSEGSTQLESPLLAEYRQRYGLSADPFADDPHFPFYTGAQRRQILDQLLHLCQFSHNLLLVAGDYGVGKTRMAQALIDALDDADDICFLEAQVTSTYDALIAEVLAQFELDDAEALSEFIQADAGRDGLVVILVDNAHHLTDQVLLDLMALQGPDARLHLVLFAEPHLLNRVENFDVPDAVLSDFYLEKLSLAEAVDYLNFRMEMADYLGPEIFSESKVEPWWRAAQGNLLQLHEYAQEKLLAPAPVSKGYSFDRKGLPVPHIIAASVLGAGLLMGFIYWGGASSKANKQTVEPVQLALSSTATLGSSSAASSNTAYSDASTTAAITTTVTNSALEAPVAVASSTSAQAAANVVTQARSSDAPVIKQSVVPLAQTNAARSELPVNLPKSVGALSSKESKKVVSSIESSKVAMKSEIAVEKPKAQSVTTGFTEQEKAILSWVDNEYTLQLVGVSSEKAVREYVAEQPNKKDLLVFRSRRQGKDWFVVITGRYPTSAKARQAAQLLPEAQKKAAPWPREIKVIQKEIRER